jgi:8-oxo-dGTP diphosphatase
VKASKPHVVVAIALVFRDGRLLVTRRPSGVHLSGFWEFPGGKLVQGESPETCAEREVAEEVGVVARARLRREAIAWEYPERRVTLYPVECDWVEGEGTPREVAELRWVERSELAELAFPDANASLVRSLVLEQRPA